MLNRYSPAGGFVRACPEFNSGMTTTISVILNLIQNQLDPDFRQDDGYGMILSASWRIDFCLLNYFLVFHPC